MRSRPALGLAAPGGATTGTTRERPASPGCEPQPGPPSGLLLPPASAPAPLPSRSSPSHQTHAAAARPGERTPLPQSADRRALSAQNHASSGGDLPGGGPRSAPPSPATSSQRIQPAAFGPSRAAAGGLLGPRGSSSEPGIHAFEAVSPGSAGRSASSPTTPIDTRPAHPTATQRRPSRDSEPTYLRNARGTPAPGHPVHNGARVSESSHACQRHNPDPHNTPTTRWDEPPQPTTPLPHRHFDGKIGDKPSTLPAHTPERNHSCHLEQPPDNLERLLPAGTSTTFVDAGEHYYYSSFT